jgi:hypothetical protein
VSFRHSAQLRGAVEELVVFIVEKVSSEEFYISLFKWFIASLCAEPIPRKEGLTTFIIPNFSAVGEIDN